MNKNVCIVHYNTPVLTAHLVKSINKYTPGTNIYIFDNSDKRPFVNSFDNVTVYDNTKGQIINFDQWLKKYPNRTKSGGKANKWGSAKHAYSVERLMELLQEPFVLLDSDVLIRKDFSSLFDEDVCYKGEVIFQPKSKVKRVVPFICFINTPMCFEKGIHYFDENYMHGLRFKNNSDNYDTGAALYLLTERKRGMHKEIKVADYIVHYGNGSWVDAAEKMKRPKHIPAMDWLNKYKDFWTDGGEDDTFEGTAFDDVFDHIYCLHYLPDSGRLPKLQSEFKRVGIDTDASYFSWVYDYPSPVLDLLFEDDRLNMDNALKTATRPYIKKVALKHYEIIKDAYENEYERVLIMENDVRFHKDLRFISKMLVNLPDADVVMLDKMVASTVNSDTRYRNFIKTLPKDTLYTEVKNVFMIFASCYVLNRKGMKHMIDRYEKSLLPPDTPFNDSGITRMVAVTNLAIQDPNLKSRKNETYNRIKLDVNQYNIDKTETVIQKPVKKIVPKASVPKPVKPKPVVVPAKKPVAKKPAPPKPSPAKKVVARPKVKTEIKRTSSGAPKKTVFHTRTIYGHNKLYDVY